MADKRVFHFTTKVEDVELRMAKKVDNTFADKKTGEVRESSYIQLRFDVGDPELEEELWIKDRTMSNLERYKRGATGTLTLRIDIEEEFGAKAKMTVIDFTGWLPEEATADEPTASDSAAIGEDAKPKRSKKA